MNTVILNRESLYEFYGDSVQDLKDIFTDYLAHRENMIRSLNKAYAEGPQALSVCVHYHSSVFSYIGLPMLTTACKNFEQLCKETDETAGLKQEFDKLVQKIYRSISIVQQEVERLNMLTIY